MSRLHAGPGSELQSDTRLQAVTERRFGPRWPDTASVFAE